MKYYLYQKYISTEICEITNKNYIDYYIGFFEGADTFIYTCDADSSDKINYRELGITDYDKFFKFLKKYNFDYDDIYIFNCKLLKKQANYKYFHRICLEDKLKNIINR